MAIPRPMLQLRLTGLTRRNGNLSLFRQSFREHHLVELANTPEARGVIQILLRQVVQSLTLSQQMYTEQCLIRRGRHGNDGDLTTSMIFDRVGLKTGVTAFRIEHRFSYKGSSLPR